MNMKKMATIPKRGRPVSNVVPVDKNKQADDLYGFVAGKATITGDVVSPTFSREEWGDLYFPSSPRRRRR